MRRFLQLFLIPVFLFPLLSRAAAPAGSEIEVTDSGQISQEHTVYRITRELDLHGGTLTLPTDCVLKFEGGTLCNGTLVGDHTQLDYDGTIFSNITVSGTWHVPYIRSSMFADIGEENVICNLAALSDDDMENEIVVDPGTYWVSFAKNAAEALVLRSHTKLVLNGDICVKPNGWDTYFVVSIRGKKDVSVSGSGSITGDREAHQQQTTGDLGMGFRIGGSERVVIQDLTLQEMWGDGVYVGGWAVSTDVVLKNLTIRNCRRQGISVTNGDGFVIENNTIHSIGGARPGAAIDLEPNVGHDERVRNIRISANHFSDCEGPVISIFSAGIGLVDSVLIEGNTIDNQTGIAMNLARRFTNVRIVGNRLCGSFSFKNNSYPVDFENNTIICPHLKFVSGDGTGDYALSGYRFAGNRIVCSGDIRARGRDSIWTDNDITVEGSQFLIGGAGSKISGNTIRSNGANTVNGGIFSGNTLVCAIRDVNRSLLTVSTDTEITGNSFVIGEVAEGASLYCLFSIPSGKCTDNTVRNATGAPVRSTTDYYIPKNGKVTAGANELDATIMFSRKKVF